MPFLFRSLLRLKKSYLWRDPFVKVSNPLVPLRSCCSKICQRTLGNTLWEIPNKSSHVSELFFHHTGLPLKRMEGVRRWIKSAWSKITQPKKDLSRKLIKRSAQLICGSHAKAMMLFDHSQIRPRRLSALSRLIVN